MSKHRFEAESDVAEYILRLHQNQRKGDPEI